MRFAIILSIVAFFMMLGSTEALCFNRWGWLSGTCGAECSARGHNGGTYKNGQCCCGPSKRSDLESKIGGKILVDEEDKVHIQQGHSVSRASCTFCDVWKLHAAGACCELSCKSVGKNSGYCQKGTCYCRK